MENPGDPSGTSEEPHFPPARSPAPAQAIQPTPPAMGHIAVRLPPFWHRSPFIWFQQVEAQFLLPGITNQLTQYRHIVASLPPEIAIDVSDVISGPPGTTPYDRLKAAVLQRTTLSERKRLQQLLTAEELGDRTPSQLLRAMQNLLADRAATFDESLLRELFLQRLPATVQMVLSTAGGLPLAQLAEHADKVMEVALPGLSIAAVSGTNRPSRGQDPPLHDCHPPL
ncbi:uncharacterized protein LOC135378810 [Ornithodoros turicata]|uniref:uncharacterized protein LOC135378810 n=1 Tax=Ornithodoros turicata TaxID=34597 RepID=UPI003138E91B